MKLSKKLSTAFAVTALAGSAAFIPATANAELSASVGIANMYLWRGQDLGNGDAAVFGDISYSAAGFYGGVWGSSGDSAAGQEYDIFAGWGSEFGIFSVDISAWTYVYPSADIYDNLGELSEGILSLGLGPVALTYYKNIAGASDYQYLTLGGSFGDFGVTVGKTFTDTETIANDRDFPFAPKEVGDEYVHLDLSYAYNDNLSFTLSAIVDDDADDTTAEMNDSTHFVVSYSIPIE